MPASVRSMLYACSSAPSSTAETLPREPTLVNTASWLEFRLGSLLKTMLRSAFVRRKAVASSLASKRCAIPATSRAWAALSVLEFSVRAISFVRLRSCYRTSLRAMVSPSTIKPLRQNNFACWSFSKRIVACGRCSSISEETTGSKRKGGAISMVVKRAPSSGACQGLVTICSAHCPRFEYIAK